MLLMTETKNEISTSTDGAVWLCILTGYQRAQHVKKSWRALEYKAPLNSVGANFLQLSP